MRTESNYGKFRTLSVRFKIRRSSIAYLGPHVSQVDSPGLSEAAGFARVGESTNDWSERSERKEVSGLAGI